MKMLVIRRVVIVVALCAVATAAFGDVPRLLTLQGKLTDSLGQPLPDGVQSVTFRLYDVETCGQGTALWQEVQNVQTNGGIFNVNLGAVTPITLPFDRQYWLGMQPPSSGELCPRTRLTTAPYAVRAEAISGPDNVFAGTGNVGIGTTSPVATLDVGGNGTIRLAPQNSMPTSVQEGTIVYSASYKSLCVYTGSSGWKMLAPFTLSASYPCEKTYTCAPGCGPCNLGTQVHCTWSNVAVPPSMNRLHVKYEWSSSNCADDYYTHNVQVLVNGYVTESFTTYQTDWLLRDNTYDVAGHLHHDGTDVVRIQLTDTSANEEDRYGFRNVYFEFDE